MIKFGSRNNKKASSMYVAKGSVRATDVWYSGRSIYVAGGAELMVASWYCINFKILVSDNDCQPMMEQLLLFHPDAQHARTQWVCIPLWSRTVLTTVGRITDPKC